MTEVIEHLVDFFIAIAVIFLFPLLYFGLKQDQLVQAIVSVKTQSLVDSIRSKGYLTADMYDHYTSNLSATGLLYNVSIEHKQVVNEPEYRFRTEDEVKNEQDSAFTGSNIYTYYPVSTNIPMVSDPISNAPLNTQTNESILASAINTPALQGHIHTAACYTGHRHTSNCESVVSGDKSQPVKIDYNVYCYYSNYDSQYYYRPYIRLTCAKCGTKLYDITYDDWENDNGQVGTTGQSDSLLASKYFSDGTYQSIGDIDRYNRISNYSSTPPSGYWLEFYSFGTYYWRTFNPAFNQPLAEFNSLHVYVKQRLATQWPSYNTNYSFTVTGFDQVLPMTAYEGCYVCGTMKKITCGQVQDETPDCSQIVTAVAPTNPIQTVATGDPIITTLTATYLDGSTNVVLGTASFSTDTTKQNQSVTITYIDAYGNMKTCTISVTVVPRNKTCTNGHTYNLNPDGSDPGCPYCRNWLRTLTIINPTSGRLTIYKGTTLPDNGVTLLATYLDGHTQTLFNEYIDNLDTQYVGVQVVTLSFKGKYVSLSVTTNRNLKLCAVCHRYYELYPDNSDPGCPYCQSRQPIFTGNVMSYYNKHYSSEILQELYEGDGVYYFNEGDFLDINVANSTNSWGRRLLSKFIKSIGEYSIITSYGGYVRENGYVE